MRQGIRIDAVQAAVAGLTIFALALRIPWLGQSFWLDEALTGYLVHSGVGPMVTGIANQSEAPLYFFIAYAWRHVFGSGEASIRMVSVLAGVATVPVGYAATRVLLNRRAGVAVAALVAASPVMVWYSVEARAYALWLLLCALALFFWAHARERDVWWAFDGWAVVSALAFATHYFAVFLIVPEAAWLIWRSANRHRALRATGGVALALAMILPLVEYQRVHGGGEWIGQNALGSRLQLANRTFTSDPTSPPGFIEVAVPVLWAIGTVLAVRRGDRRMRRGALALLGLVGAGLGIALLAALLGADYVLDRNLLLLWVPLAGVVATAAGVRGTAGTVGALLVAAICGLFVWQDLARHSTFKRDDWRHVARVIGPARSDRLVVLAPLFEQPVLAYYSPGLREAVKPRRVADIYTVTHFGGNPWQDPLRQGTPRAPFGRSGAPVVVQPGTLVLHFRANRPTLVEPRSLHAPGKAGSVVLSWAGAER